MKNIFVLAAFAVLSVSCTVDYGDDCMRTAGYLESVGESLVDMSAVHCVNWLYETCMTLPACNEDGFVRTNSEEQDSGIVVNYRFVRTGDNLWSVEIASGEMIKGSLEVSREPVSSDHGDLWTVLPFVLDYNEGNGYSARLSTKYDIQFEWVYSDSPLPSWTLAQSGIYSLETFVGDIPGDSGQLQYSNGSLLFSGGPGY